MKSSTATERSAIRFSGSFSTVSSASFITSSKKLSEELEIPIRTTRTVLYDLYTINVATRTFSDSKNEELCQIAVPPESLTPVGLYCKLNQFGHSGYDSDSLDYVRKLTGEIRKDAECSPKNLPLSELPSYMDKNKV